MARLSPGRAGAFLLAAALALPGILAATGTAHAMRDTESRLFEALRATPDIRARVPAGRELSRLAFAGFVAPGDLIFADDPTAIATVPLGLANTVARNCATRETRTADGNLEGSFVESTGMTTTRGWEVGTEVTVEANWPGGSASGSINAAVSGSTATTRQESREITVRQGWSAPVLPGTEFDIQLTTVRLLIEDLAYFLDLELRGPADLYHRPVLDWVRSTGRVPAGAVIAGRETVPGSGELRMLPLCRARYAGTTHPGKVVAGNCNISYGGREYERRPFEVLVGGGTGLDWEAHERGSTDADLGVVAGQENREAHDGKLYVCRASHRGGVHPGKLVNNDCMFGYGGEEIEVDDYEILIFDDSAEESFRVDLQQYLDLAQRTFRVEGRFQGAKGLNTAIVFGESRPVDPAVCPGALAASRSPAQDPEGAKTPAAASASVERAAPVARRAAATRSTSAGRDPAAAPAGPALIDGTVYTRADLTGDGPPRPRLQSRLLRLETPALLGADVLAVQEALRAAGWPIRADGFHGPVTDRALRHFQRANGLAADGLVGPLTLDRLGL
ncbi:MAG: DUF3421 domain-containing protein [Azospirillaceae bacterium]